MAWHLECVPFVILYNSSHKGISIIVILSTADNTFYMIQNAIPYVSTTQTGCQISQWAINEHLTLKIMNTTIADMIIITTKACTNITLMTIPYLLRFFNQWFIIVDIPESPVGAALSVFKWNALYLNFETSRCDGKPNMLCVVFSFSWWINI